MKAVFPHSLRARLLWYLLGAIIITATFQAAVAFRTALAETDEIFDYQMQQMAASLRAGLPATAVEFDPNPASDEDNIEFIVQVRTAEGKRVFQSTARADLPKRATPGFSNIESHGVNYRVFSAESGNQIVQIAQDIAARQKMAGSMALRTIAPVALTVPLLLLVVWWVVSTSLSPVERVRLQLAARQADDLSEVNEGELPDEIAPLVHELNMLFKRLDIAFSAQRSFVADAAHELRSPLAALKLQIQGLRRSHDDSTREVAVERLTAGIDRSTRMVEQLLILARQQAHLTEELKKDPVHLEDLVQRVLADLWDTAHVRKVDIGLVTKDEFIVSAQGDALQILVRNLVDNAIKYTPPGGSVNVSIHRRDRWVTLTVEDSGPGIPGQDQARVFDRFYRVPGATVGGSGLGLSIVKTIADLHSAHLSISQSESLGGLNISVAFPVES